MKKLILLLLIFPLVTFAQVDLSAGMGINLTSHSSLKDYVNINFSSPGNEVKSFETEAEFFAEADYSISNQFDVGLEYALSIYSYTNFIFLSTYDLSFVSHKPSILGYYVIKGKGYKFKFGGGIGIRYNQLSEQLPTSTIQKDYSTLGFGLLAKAVGITALGKNIFAFIGTDARLDFPGEPESSGKKIFNGALNENLNLNSVSIGLKLGITYSF